ncbi:hypothetical protein ACFODL_06410 [Phenylobacterium terrae]
MAWMFGLVASLVASPAAACLEIPTAKGMAKTFAVADTVVDVQALTEAYVPVPNTMSLRVGIATARVLRVYKGSAREGYEITYRVLDGEWDGNRCPGRRFTRPDGKYRLYLKFAGDGGPPVIIHPTDAQSLPLR